MVGRDRLKAIEVSNITNGLKEDIDRLKAIGVSNITNGRKI